MKLKQTYKRTIIFTVIVSSVFIAALVFVPDLKIEINPDEVKFGSIFEKVLQVIVDLLKSTWKA
ncbi:MAG: hypothetical protein EPN82_13200 [Bacteroidetes bacterium]|nr:MAG: hypothetical protein EPN82_13200 [Bacteroidota bacterium]